MTHCTCGRKRCNCDTWERIYREKHEDPSYYTRPVAALNLQSTLNGNIRFGEGFADRRQASHHDSGAELGWSE